MRYPFLPPAPRTATLAAAMLPARTPPAPTAAAGLLQADRGRLHAERVQWGRKWAAIAKGAAQHNEGSTP